MPLLSGTLTARFWRVEETVPPNFRDSVERNLQRHAFRPIDLDKGELSSMGWVNIRQMLDTRLTLEKTMFGEWVALGLRVDRLAINQKLFRAELAQQIGKALREKEGGKLSKEERLVLEDKVKMDLLKRTQPGVNVYDMAWNIVSGQVVFGASGEKINNIFADLFAETFQVSVEPQLPFFRARDWAARQKLETELLELLPAPFSPTQPKEVVEMMPESDED